MPAQQSMHPGQPRQRSTRAGYAGAEKPDGWWAPRFELDSSEKFGSVSLVGSPQPYPEEAYSAESIRGRPPAVGRLRAVKNS